MTTGYGGTSPAPTPPPPVNPGLPFDSLQQQLYNQQTLHHPHTILKNINAGPQTTTGVGGTGGGPGVGGGSSSGGGTGSQVPHAAMSEMRV